jgi:hypothetical protein
MAKKASSVKLQPEQKFIEKIQNEERLKIYEALRALEIVNYSIPEDVWFVKLKSGAVIYLDQWIDNWEKSSGSR